METIAEINDLACRCIETGDYQVALDALNSSLNCVKLLKKCRTPAASDSATGDVTRESITATLLEAKRKVFYHSKKYTMGSKRKGDHFHTRSRKRKRQPSLNDQEEFHTGSGRVSSNSPSEHYFVYSTPIRLSLFQWTQIAKYRYLEYQFTASKQDDYLRRHVELAISANLIFNIALSHHLLTTNSRKVRIPRLSTDSGEDSDDTYSDEDDHEYTNALQKKERLRGALRLYEIGFRVHTKRMALIMSSKRQRSRNRYPEFSSLSIPNTIPTIPSFPRTEQHLQRQQASLSIDDLRSLRRERQIGRNDELKSTTRFALALLNNCAHIHSALGQHEKAKIFEKRLLSFLLVIIDGGESIHEIIGDDPAVDGYLKNVFDGTVFDRKAAPAAMA